MVLSVSMLTMPAPADDTAAYPVHWWIGNAHGRANCKTANMVASWTIAYQGPYKKEYEARRMHRQVGDTDKINTCIEGIKDNYAQNARLLATDHENWSAKTGAEQAQEFVNSIDERAGLSVIQWNNRLTWDPAALAIIANHPRLQLVEMTYPTCEKKTTAAEIYDWIILCLTNYSAGTKPVIGLSVYTGHDMKTAVSWELMKLQIDVAKKAGRDKFGSNRHPLGVFIADMTPAGFTIDDVNNYIIYGTRTPPCAAGQTKIKTLGAKQKQGRSTTSLQEQGPGLGIRQIK